MKPMVEQIWNEFSARLGQLIHARVPLWFHRQVQQGLADGLAGCY